MASPYHEAETVRQQEVVPTPRQEGIQATDSQLEAAITSMDVAGLHGGGQPEITYIQEQQATESLQVVAAINGESSTTTSIPIEAEPAMKDVTADPNAMAQGVGGSQTVTRNERVPNDGLMRLQAEAIRVFNRMAAGPAVVTPEERQRLSLELQDLNRQIGEYVGTEGALEAKPETDPANAPALESKEKANRESSVRQRLLGWR